MANLEHLEILNQGVKAWNVWRNDNRDIRPDLSRAILNSADLVHANLKEALLSDADLRRARLCGADLRNTKLNNTILNDATLEQAILIGADLRDASLQYANLENAALTDAILAGGILFLARLNGAILLNTDFSDAKIGQVSFSNVDLSAARGLETVEHTGPSYISIDTIYKSQGKIPDVFLRGCGVPESFITFQKSLVNNPIEFYSCFISYSHADKSFARRLHDQLQARGIRCWLDEHQMLPGHDLFEEVDRGIKLWDKVLLCGSKHSLTSWWVDDEIQRAFGKEQQLMKERGSRTLALIPLNLDGYMFGNEWQSAKAQQIKSRLAADFTGWESNNAKFEREFERVVKALRMDGGREEAPVGKL